MSWRDVGGLAGGVLVAYLPIGDVVVYEFCGCRFQRFLR